MEEDNTNPIKVVQELKRLKLEVKRGEPVVKMESHVDENVAKRSDLSTQNDDSAITDAPTKPRQSNEQQPQNKISEVTGEEPMRSKRLKFRKKGSKSKKKKKKAAGSVNKNLSRNNSFYTNRGKKSKVDKSQSRTKLPKRGGTKNMKKSNITSSRNLLSFKTNSMNNEEFYTKKKYRKKSKTKIGYSQPKRGSPKAQGNHLREERAVDILSSTRRGNNYKNMKLRINKITKEIINDSYDMDGVSNPKKGNRGDGGGSKLGGGTVDGNKSKQSLSNNNSNYYQSPPRFRNERSQESPFPAPESQTRYYVKQANNSTTHNLMKGRLDLSKKRQSEIEKSSLSRSRIITAKAKIMMKPPARLAQNTQSRDMGHSPMVKRNRGLSTKNGSFDAARDQRDSDELPRNINEFMGASYASERRKYNHHYAKDLRSYKRDISATSLTNPILRRVQEKLNGSNYERTLRTPGDKRVNRDKSAMGSVDDKPKGGSSVQMKFNRLFSPQNSKDGLKVNISSSKVDRSGQDEGARKKGKLRQRKKASPEISIASCTPFHPKSSTIKNKKNTFVSPIRKAKNELLRNPKKSNSKLHKSKPRMRKVETLKNFNSRTMLRKDHNKSNANSSITKPKKRGLTQLSREKSTKTLTKSKRNLQANSSKSRSIIKKIRQKSNLPKFQNNKKQLIPVKGKTMTAQESLNDLKKLIIQYVDNADSSYSKKLQMNKLDKEIKRIKQKIGLSRNSSKRSFSPSLSKSAKNLPKAKGKRIKKTVVRVDQMMKKTDDFIEKKFLEIQEKYDIKMEHRNYPSSKGGSLEPSRMSIGSCQRRSYSKNLSVADRWQGKSRRGSNTEGKTGVSLGERVTKTFDVDKERTSLETSNFNDDIEIREIDISESKDPDLVFGIDMESDLKSWEDESPKVSQVVKTRKANNLIVVIPQDENESEEGSSAYATTQRRRSKRGAEELNKDKARLTESSSNQPPLMPKNSHRSKENFYNKIKFNNESEHQSPPQPIELNFTSENPIPETPPNQQQLKVEKSEAQSKPHYRHVTANSTRPDSPNRPTIHKLVTKKVTVSPSEAKFPDSLQDVVEHPAQNKVILSRVLASSKKAEASYKNFIKKLSFCRKEDNSDKVGAKNAVFIDNTSDGESGSQITPDLVKVNQSALKSSNKLNQVSKALSKSSGSPFLKTSLSNSGIIEKIKKAIDESDCNKRSKIVGVLKRKLYEMTQVKKETVIPAPVIPKVTTPSPGLPVKKDTKKRNSLAKHHQVNDKNTPDLPSEPLSYSMSPQILSKPQEQELASKTVIDNEAVLEYLSQQDDKYLVGLYEEIMKRTNEILELKNKAPRFKLMTPSNLLVIKDYEKPPKMDLYYLSKLRRALEAGLPEFRKTPAEGGGFSYEYEEEGLDDDNSVSSASGIFKIDDEPNLIEKVKKNKFFNHFHHCLQSIAYTSTMMEVREDDLVDKMVYLPPKRRKDLKTLILDLDETLIHCDEDLSKPNDIVTDIRFAGGEIVKCGVSIRPYASEFIKLMSKYFEIVIFTASHSCYANIILNILDPENEYITYRMFREYCYETEEGIFLKDLRIFKNRKIEDIILVDNACYSYANQISSGVPIIPYFRGNRDRELVELAGFLMSFIDKDDLQGVFEKDDDENKEFLLFLEEVMRLRYGYSRVHRGVSLQQGMRAYFKGEDFMDEVCSLGDSAPIKLVERLIGHIRGVERIVGSRQEGVENPNEVVESGTA